MADLSDLDETAPVDIDLLSVGDDELRGTKASVKGAFTSLSSTGGMVNTSAAEFNRLAGVTSNVQTQIDNILQISWAQVYPDSSAGTTDKYNLAPNTKSMLRVSSPSQLLFECTLPAISASTDGETIEIRPLINAINSRIVQLVAPVTETMRLWDTKTDAWQDVSFANLFGDPIMPHVNMTFSGHYNQWVVWLRTGLVGQII